MWKKLPYFVKGGLLGLLIGLILDIYFLTNFNQSFMVICDGGYCPTAWEMFINGKWVTLLVFPISLFILGTITGLIYVKIKNHRKNPENLPSSGL